MSDSQLEESSAQPRLSRRQTMQWVMAAVAASALPNQKSFAADPVEKKVGVQEAGGKQPPPVIGKGYGLDPKMTQPHKPGDVWPLTFNERQRKAAKALADVIIPKDDLGPAASEVGIVEMIDEWVSAPYDQQKADRPVVLDGIAWLDTESQRRFKKDFAALATEQKHAICDDICYTQTAKRQFRKAAAFFSRFRTIAAGAYYATPAGWKAIGYVGNIPLGRFDGPPQEVLQKLGVEQTVE